MSLQHTLTPPGATPTTDSRSTRQGRSRLRHARRGVAWAAWLVMAAIALGLFALGVPARFDELHTQYQGQIGLDVSRNTHGQIVLSPQWEGAAAGAGILDGDVLVAVDGVPVTRARTVPPERVIPSGEAGTKVTLSVRSPGFSTRRYTIVRGGDDGLTLAQLGLSSGLIATYAVAIDIISALLFFAIATVLIWRRADNWLAVLVSMLLLLVFLGISLPVVSLYRAHPGLQSTLDIWFALGFAALCAFFYLFPDGKPVPGWTLLLMGLLLLWTFAGVPHPELYPWKQAPLTFFLIVLGWLITGVLAQAYRFWLRADAIQRQQTKWIVFGAGAAALGVTAEVWHVAWFQPSSTIDVVYDLAVYPVSRLLTVLLPLSIGIAILRYRLWDIDLILNRTLVYGSLTAGVVGLYILIVGGVSALLQSRGNLVISLLASGVIAILFHPMREHLQMAVNHLLYGERDEPYTVLSRLGERLGAAIAPSSVLSSIVGTVAEALKVPYAAIVVNHHGSPVLEAAHGLPTDDLLVLPLLHQSEPVGQLMLAPRAPGDIFTPADRRLLEDLAREIGVAIHAMLLTIDLQWSRERLVTAREEERRRLRRDLHDGLGPALSSVLFKVAAARRLLTPDSPAEPLLSEVRSDLHGVIADIRRLVHALRPAVLDELGLVQALRQQAAQYGHGELQITVDAPDDLPALPAAVEVAAYRIVQEAVTNVVRHAEATTCHLRLATQTTGSRHMLTLEIVDNGRGLQAGRHDGIGLRSMEERVAELGGRFTVEPNVPAGTVVRALLPFPEEGPMP